MKPKRNAGEAKSWPCSAVLLSEEHFDFMGRCREVKKKEHDAWKKHRKQYLKMESKSYLDNAEKIELDETLSDARRKKKLNDLEIQWNITKGILNDMPNDYFRVRMYETFLPYNIFQLNIWKILYIFIIFIMKMPILYYINNLIRKKKNKNTFLDYLPLVLINIVLFIIFFALSFLYYSNRFLSFYIIYFLFNLIVYIIYFLIIDFNRLIQYLPIIFINILPIEYTYYIINNYKRFYIPKLF